MLLVPDSTDDDDANVSAKWWNASPSLEPEVALLLCECLDGAMPCSCCWKDDDGEERRACAPVPLWVTVAV